MALLAGVLLVVRNGARRRVRRRRPAHGACAISEQRGRASCGAGDFSRASRRNRATTSWPRWPRPSTAWLRDLGARGDCQLKAADRTATDAPRRRLARADDTAHGAARGTPGEVLAMSDLAQRSRDRRTASRSSPTKPHRLERLVGDLLDLLATARSRRRLIRPMPEDVAVENLFGAWRRAPRARGPDWTASR